MHSSIYMRHCCNVKFHILILDLPIEFLPHSFRCLWSQPSAFVYCKNINKKCIHFFVVVGGKVGVLRVRIIWHRSLWGKTVGTKHKDWSKNLFTLRDQKIRHQKRRTPIWYIRDYNFLVLPIGQVSLTKKSQKGNGRRNNWMEKRWDGWRGGECYVRRRR